MNNVKIGKEIFVEIHYPYNNVTMRGTVIKVASNGAEIIALISGAPDILLHLWPKMDNSGYYGGYQFYRSNLDRDWNVRYAEIGSGENENGLIALNNYYEEELRIVKEPQEFIETIHELYEASQLMKKLSEVV